jgi:hypothetical protein
LQRLILFSVNTGSWTALFALLTIILVRSGNICQIFRSCLKLTLQMHTYLTESISMVFATPLCSVYCNTVLANLNARQYIRSETTGHNIDTEQVIGSRGIDVIMISTDGQKEKKMSISSAPIGQVSSLSMMMMQVVVRVSFLREWSQYVLTLIRPGSGIRCRLQMETLESAV